MWNEVQNMTSNIKGSGRVCICIFIVQGVRRIIRNIRILGWWVDIMGMLFWTFAGPSCKPTIFHMQTLNINTQVSEQTCLLKKCRPRSDCSAGSNLTWVYTVNYQLSLFTQCRTVKSRCSSIRMSTVTKDVQNFGDNYGRLEQDSEKTR